MPKTSIGKSRRRWFSLSLRLFMLLVAVLAIPLAWKINHARAQRRAIDTIERLGGRVNYEYQYANGHRMEKRPDPGPKWLHTNLGEDYFHNVTRVSGFLLEPRSTRSADLLTPIEAFDRLDCLDLDGSTITDRELTHIKVLKRLRYLRIRGSNVTGRGLENLKGLRELRSLDFSFTPILDEGLSHLASLSKLEKLDLSSTGVTDAGIVHLRNMPRLRSLRLGGTRVSAGGLRHLSNIASLRELELDFIEGFTDDRDAHYLAEASGLEELTLNGWTDSGAAALARLTNLKRLKISGDRISNAGLAHLKELVGLDQLDLSNTKVSDAGLAHLCTLSGLRYLDLHQTRVTDAGIAQLEAALASGAKGIRIDH